jgi:hypothetical protein
MAYIKPGAVKGPYTWTGKRWVRTPERTQDKVTLKKEIDKIAVAKTKSSQSKQMTETNAMSKYPGGAPDMSSTKGVKADDARKKREAAAKVSAKASAYNPSTAAKRMGTKPADKPAPSATPSGNKTTPSSGSSSNKTPAKKTATVSQSNTEWVKKGDVVNGKTVTKGYVAQKGKPERKVTAKVKLVVDTARGKAGSKVSYTKGKATKKK